MALLVTGMTACGSSEAAPAEEEAVEVEAPDISEEDIQAAADKAVEESGINNTANAINLYGNWVGESFEYQGVTMSLEEAEMTFSIEFKIDGTAVALTNGESDGSATFEVNDDGSITLKDGTGTLPVNSYIDESGILHLALDADEDTMWILCHKE